MTEITESLLIQKGYCKNQIGPISSHVFTKKNIYIYKPVLSQNWVIREFNGIFLGDIISNTKHIEVLEAVENTLVL